MMSLLCRKGSSEICRSAQFFLHLKMSVMQGKNNHVVNATHRKQQEEPYHRLLQLISFCTGN